MLRKSRSLNLHLANACGNCAIDLLRAVIRHRCSVVKGVGSEPSSLKSLGSVSRPGVKRIVDTVEQIAVEPSIRSRVRPIAGGRSNSLKLSRLLSRLIQLNHLKERARVIQIARNLAASENLLAGGQVAVRIGLSNRERHIKNSVALCATTLCARRWHAWIAITRRWVMWGRSPRATACKCC